MLKYRKEFCQESTWRKALGNQAALMPFNDPEFESLDAPIASPAGSTIWCVVVARGIGAHTYGAMSTITLCR